MTIIMTSTTLLTITIFNIIITFVKSHMITTINFKHQAAAVSFEQVSEVVSDKPVWEPKPLTIVVAWAAFLCAIVYLTMEAYKCFRFLLRTFRRRPAVTDPGVQNLMRQTELRLRRHHIHRLRRVHYPITVIGSLVICPGVPCPW